jgi:uncharacterized OsmC-like protein
LSGTEWVSVRDGVAFFGPLDAEQRLRLAEIAERCPVQRTLQREVHIDQHVVEAAQG